MYENLCLSSSSSLAIPVSSGGIRFTVFCRDDDISWFPRGWFPVSVGFFYNQITHPSFVPIPDDMAEMVEIFRPAASIFRVNIAKHDESPVWILLSVEQHVGADDFDLFTFLRVCDFPAWLADNPFV